MTEEQSRYWLQHPEEAEAEMERRIFVWLMKRRRERNTFRETFQAREAAEARQLRAVS
jgi:hypothetical protein